MPRTMYAAALGVVVGFLLGADNAMANFITVDPSGVTSPYTTIQAALDAASAGETIDVDPGTYNENLTINLQGITLEGAQAGVNPVGGRSGPESVLDGTITITAPGVTLNGFTITANSQWAIEVGGAGVAKRGCDKRGHQEQHRE